MNATLIQCKAVGITTLFLGLMAIASVGRATDVTPPTVADTVSLKTFRIGNFSPLLAMSGNRQQLAYVLDEPDLTENMIKTVVYVQAIRNDAVHGQSREVFRTTGIRTMKWLDDSRHLLVLDQPVGGRGRIVKIDCSSGKLSVVYEGVLDAEQFAVSTSGSRIVIAGNLEEKRRPVASATPRGVVVDEGENLFRLEDEAHGQKGLAITREILVVEGKTTRVLYRAPYDPTHEPWIGFGTLTMSPDGRFVTWESRNNDVRFPSEWGRDPLYQSLVNTGHPYAETVIRAELPDNIGSIAGEDGLLGTNALRLGFDAPSMHPGGAALHWSDDSSGYVLSMVDPVGDGVAVAKETGRAAGRNFHFYWVDAATGRASLLDEQVPLNVLAVTSHPLQILIIDANQNVVSFSQREGQADASAKGPEHTSWQKQVVDDHSLHERGGYFQGYPAVSDGQSVFCIRQSTMVPPDLWKYELASGRKEQLTEINPQVSQHSLGRVERIEWPGTYGHTYWGQLIYPVGYEEGKRYPAVLMSQSWDDSFIYGAQEHLRANFPPQVLANNGFVILLINHGTASIAKAKGLPTLPGRMGEGELAADQFYTARNQLVERKLIDPAKVGIMGFSRSSWKVDYVLSHPKSGEPWSAAVSVDGGLYNYLAGVITSTGIRMDAAVQFGGPPYGETFESYREYAPAFNADHVRTPLLMQYNGSVLGAAEFFSALHDQGKPVELIYFPNGQHNLELPSEREASMQQTVDWFRFWLQGYERSVPEDAERFGRWRKLRERHLENERLLSLGQDPKEKWLRNFGVIKEVSPDSGSH